MQNVSQTTSYTIFHSYIISNNNKALILDPIRENTALYLSYLAYHNLSLKFIVDSHSHADHISASFYLKRLTNAVYAMHTLAPAPKVDLHLEHGSTLDLGGLDVKVIHTPGHTPDSISLYDGKHVFPGDTLLIGGCGRTDFSGGDPAQSYDSITKRLFTLPDETIVYPAHDYRFNTSSTILKEKQSNPRLLNKTKPEFIHLMNTLGLPLPEKIMEALQINTTALDEETQISPLPTYSQLISIPQETNFLTLESDIKNGELLVLDVREPEEFKGALKGVEGSKNFPLKDLAKRVGEIEGWKGKRVVCVCRAGFRSTTACSILVGFGFENVGSLKGGLLDFEERKR